MTISIFLLLKLLLFLFFSVSIRWSIFIKEYVEWVSDTMDRDCVHEMMVVEIPFHRFVGLSNVLDIFVYSTWNICMSASLGHQQSFHLVYTYYHRTAHEHSPVSIEYTVHLRFLPISFERKMLKKRKIKIRKEKKKKKQLLNKFHKSIIFMHSFDIVRKKRLLLFKKTTHNFVNALFLFST